MTKKPILKNAVLEIGSEEIPARFIPIALQQLSTFLSDGLKKAGLDCSKIEVWGTPRRLVATLQGLPPRAKDRVDIAIGPPPQAAKDANGEWTPAARGFAKSQKVSVNTLEVRTTSKGERLVAVHLIKGSNQDTILKELFPSAIQSLVFPKSMVWEEKGFRFARPLRWVLALLNSRVIRFEVAGLFSDRNTMGLLALGGKKISIPHADKYKTILQGRCILVDQEIRSKTIRSQMEALGKRINSRVWVTPENLEEVVFLTEYPVSLLGHFKEEYLKLPREVLISSLIKHQKFFPIESLKGELTNNFLGVRNGPSDSQDTVRDGYMRVINARLSDAQFFYEHDLKTPLIELVPRLEGIGFLEKMGTLLDKMERTRKLADNLAGHIGFSPAQKTHVDRIAQLAKADLLTQMVGEFPELQGVAGRFYAAHGEHEMVSTGIEEHYWPLTAEGTLPSQPEAALVSIADKLDTMAAHFALGQIPSGSADPNGLRRLGAGVIRILVDRKWNLDLSNIISMACSLLPVDSEIRIKTCRDLLEFLYQRYSNWLSHQGYRADEIESVLTMNKDPLYVTIEKLEGLKTVRGRIEFESLAAAIKRARNILKQAEERRVLPASTEIQIGQLVDPAEKSLWSSLESVRPVVANALEKRDFKRALLSLVPLKGPVDDFFEGVMVMVDDPQQRSLRLSLLKQVKDLFDSLADFSKLQGISSAGL